MSLYSKAKDRDAKGRVKRAYRSKHRRNPWLCTPGWWVRQYMSRPRRQQNHRVCRAVEKGADPEGLVFPLGNGKPHVYCW